MVLTRIKDRRYPKLCHWVQGSSSFKGLCCLHLQGQAVWNARLCTRRYGTTHPVTELHVPAVCAKCHHDSYLLLGQLLAASHLADLVALVVPTRSAISTVVLALTACAFTTSLALLLHGLLTFTIRDRGSVGTGLKG